MVVELTPQLRIEQPRLFCLKCEQEIPDNENVHRDPTVARKRAGLIACPNCAKKAGGKIEVHHAPAKGRDLEKYGQQTVAETCGSIPMLEIK